MRSPPAYVSPAVLRWARESIGYELEDAAEKIGVSGSKLADAEAGERLLTMRQAEKAARVFERPLAALFISEPLVEEPQEAQFRRLPGAPEPPWPPAMIALARRTRERQDAAAELHEVLEEPSVWTETRRALSVPTNKASTRARELLGIGIEEQTSWRDRDGYLPLRSWLDAVEGLGVLVMQDGNLTVSEMRGFASLDDVVPAIIVNTQDDPRARAFTILHELGHLYLATRGETMADGEGWCERFAGEVLMPRAHFVAGVREYAGVDDLRTFDQVALSFGVTPRAAVVRARREDLIDQETTNRVLDQIAARGRRSRGGGGNYYWNELGRLGPAYSRLVFSALESQAVTYSAASSLLGGMKVNHFEKFRSHLERRGEMA